MPTIKYNQPIYRFAGLHTRKDPTKIMSGESQDGQGFINKPGGTMATRKGHEVFDGATSTSAFFYGVDFFATQGQETGFVVGLCADSKYRWGDTP